MNRLGHAHVDVHRELEHYFISGQHDDLWGALKTLGIDAVTAPKNGWNQWCTSRKP